MSAVEEVATEAPAVEAVPKRAMTLGLGTSLVVLAALVIAPLFVKNFIIFQMTMLLIYGLAVLALNILTGGSGQFSLGQSAFYAVGAYTSAILMEHANMNYALTLPIAGRHLLRLRLPVRQAGAAALRRLSRAGDVRAGDRDAAAPEAELLRALDRRRAGAGRDQARRAVRPADVAGHVAVLLHARDHDRRLYRLGNLLRSRSGRAFMAIRDNEIAASAMGVDVALYRRWRSASRPASPASPAASAPSRCSSWRPTAHHRARDLAVPRHGGRRRRLAAGIDRRFGLHHLRAEYRRGDFQGLSGAVFGVLLFLVIFLVPHGARQVAMVAQQLIGKLKKWNPETQEK